MEATEQLLVDARMAAKMLAISPRTLWTLTDQGKVPYLRIGWRVLYDPRDLRDVIDKIKNGVLDTSVVSKKYKKEFT